MTRSATRALQVSPSDQAMLVLERDMTETLQGLGQDDQERADYLERVGVAARNTPAGRGGRLEIALKDLNGDGDLPGALALAQSSDPKDQALAETMRDNALWRLGRLAAMFDEEGKLAEGVARLARHQGDLVAADQIDYLHQRGLISDQERDQLRPQAAELYAEAFGSDARGARWRPIALLYRAARAQEALEAVEVPAGGDLDKLKTYALKEADKMIAASSGKMRGEKVHDGFLSSGPTKMTRLMAIATALSDPQTRELNLALDEGGIVDEHRQLVAEVGKPKERPVMALADHQWLNQMMNSQAMITEETYGTQAVSVDRVGIFLAPEVATDTLDDHSRGQMNDVLVHELVHTTQPACKGRPLADDDSHPDADRTYYDRHRYFEFSIMEGATQSLTNDLSRARGQEIGPEMSSVYAGATLVVDEAAQLLSPSDPRAFRAELSATPTYQRAALLARRASGSDDEASQRRLFERLLPLIERASVCWDDDQELGRCRAEVRSILSGR